MARLSIRLTLRLCEGNLDGVDLVAETGESAGTSTQVRNDAGDGDKLSAHEVLIRSHKDDLARAVRRDPVPDSGLEMNDRGLRRSSDGLGTGNTLGSLSGIGVGQGYGSNITRLTGDIQSGSQPSPPSEPEARQ